MKADDPNDFMLVIAGVNRVQDFYAELIKFLTMARKKIKDNNIDTEMVYSFARINKLAELEDFISATNIAKVRIFLIASFLECEGGERMLHSLELLSLIPSPAPTSWRPMLRRADVPGCQDSVLAHGQQRQACVHVRQARRLPGCLRCCEEGF